MDLSFVSRAEGWVVVFLKYLVFTQYLAQVTGNKNQGGTEHCDAQNTEDFDC